MSIDADPAQSGLPENSRLMAALDATWPAGAFVEAGPWRLRRDDGGGNRVTAASLLPGGAGGQDLEAAIDAAIEAAAAQMTAWGQPALFSVVPGHEMLDAALEARGYRIHEPVVLYAAKAEAMVGEGGHVAAAYRAQFAPAILEEIWETGGIGPARRAIMTRPTGPKSILLSRAGDRPAGGAFVAVDGDVAMIHAIEVLDRYRRMGCARLLMEVAARFAVENGAEWLTLAVTVANSPARALYAQLGMAEAGRYHYRIAPAEGD